MAQYPYSQVNTDLGLLATLTAASTGTVAVVPSGATYFNNPTCNRAVFRFYCSAETGTTPTLNLILQGYDTASGLFYTIGSTGAITVAASTMYTLYVGPGVGSLSTPEYGIAIPMPPYWRLQYTIAGTTPAITGTIGGALLVP